MKMERPLDREVAPRELIGISLSRIDDLLNKPLEIGDTWYVLARPWYEQFRGHTGLDHGESVNKDHPGPIDNTPIIDSETNEMREHLIEQTDYVFIPEEMWILMFSWYGMVSGQEPLAKKVVEYGVFNSYCKVEVVGLNLTLWKDFDEDNPTIGKFSHGDTTEYLHKKIRDIFNVPEEVKSRLWGGFSPSLYEPLESSERTAMTTGLYHNQVVVIEVQPPGGIWTYQYRRMKETFDDNNKRTFSYPQLPTSAGASCFSTSSEPCLVTTSADICHVTSPEPSPIAVPESCVEPVVEGASSLPRKRVATSSGIPTSTVTGVRSASRLDSSSAGQLRQTTPGLCGLGNLGNTCFMNAIMQCLSNVPPITAYFRSRRHLLELNVNNPLGMNGEIAKSYAEVVRTLWSGQFAFGMPHNFKQKVGAFAPSFSGYQQQDAQELLTFLLDGLHEDLNRIQVKPYIALQDSNGRPDEEVAEEAWANYLRRNDSIIVDNFHGLLKSTVVCPDCLRVSVTFDPFVSLSLPLPIVKERTIELTLVFYDIVASPPIVFKLGVPIRGSVGDLVSILSGHCRVAEEQLMVVHVVQSHFHQIFEANQPMSSINPDDDIYVYELPRFAANLDKFAVLPVCLWEYTELQTRTCNQLFGIPFVIVVSRLQLTYSRVTDLIWRKLKTFMHEPMDNRYRGLDLIASELGVASNDNRIVGDNVNEPSEQTPFLVYYANDPELSDLIVLEPGSNVIRLPGVIGRRTLVVGLSHVTRSRCYNEKAFKNFKIKDKSANQVADEINLSECFQHYTVEEKLGAQDAWYCPQCRKHQCASKKFDLWRLPPILVLHLKRFSFTRSRRMKLDVMVDAPITNMDLSEYVIGPDNTKSTKYNLIGVTNHSGTLGGGHYTASALHAPTNTWHNFDDTTVSPLVGKPVHKGTYVLFYMRTDVFTEQMDTD